MTTSNVYLSYDHQTGEFKELKDQTKFEKIVKGTISEIAESLDGLGIDGLLIFNRDGSKWQLVFSKQLGLVGQRTSRRQADTISRSGFLLVSGERVGARSPLEQLTDDNIGDLHKTVQEKYITSDLTGFKGDSRK